LHMKPEIPIEKSRCSGVLQRRQESTPRMSTTDPCDSYLAEESRAKNGHRCPCHFAASGTADKRAPSCSTAASPHADLDITMISEDGEGLHHRAAARGECTPSKLAKRRKNTMRNVSQSYSGRKDPFWLSKSKR